MLRQPFLGSLWTCFHQLEQIPELQVRDPDDGEDNQDPAPPGDFLPPLIAHMLDLLLLANVLLRTLTMDISFLEEIVRGSGQDSDQAAAQDQYPGAHFAVKHDL